MGRAPGGLWGTASLSGAARLRRGESESCLITYRKTSKPGILKLSITA